MSRLDVPCATSGNMLFMILINDTKIKTLIKGIELKPIIDN
jgi:hypothetical protein